MAWSTNNSHDLTLPANSTKTICIPCISILTDIYAAIFTVNFLIALPVSGWVLRLMMSSPSFLTEKTDVFSFNLIVYDVLFNLATLLVTPGLYLYHQVTQYVWSFCFNFMVVGKPLLQCCICLERYLAVKHPFTFLKYRPLRYRAAVLLMAWMAVILYCSITTPLCIILENWLAFMSPLQCTILLLIFVFNSFCCLSILPALLRPSPGDEAGGGERGKEVQKYEMKKKAFTTILMFQILMVFCYLPPVVIYALRSLMNQTMLCASNACGLCLIMLSSLGYSFCNLISMSNFTWLGCARKE